jgi:dCMP deaminase
VIVKKEILRPSWDAYFAELVKAAATRSTCLRRSVGAILVKSNRVLATGYNGAPKGLVHCDKTGCLREKLKVPSGERHEICRGLHAEQNAIIQAALYGVSIVGSTIYCTNKPCSICTKMIINSEIERIVYLEDYKDDLAEELIRQTDIRILQFKGDQ